MRCWPKIGSDSCTFQKLAPALAPGAGAGRTMLITFSFSNAFVFRFLRKEKKWGKYGALLLLPNEVLFDVFKFLNRRQLTNLESVCLRFHRIISDHMGVGETPFHRLRLDIGFGFATGFLLFYF